MKLCNSPANTTCMYQRIARDQADPDDAQAGAGAQAYEELCTFLADHLDPNDLGEAEALLRQFVDKIAGRTRLNPQAMDAQIRAGKAQAQQFLFNKRFPGAARIRSV
jgi:hypothetical protein